MLKEGGGRGRRPSWEGLIREACRGVFLRDIIILNRYYNVVGYITHLTERDERQGLQDDVIGRTVDNPQPGVAVAAEHGRQRQFCETAAAGQNSVVVNHKYKMVAAAIITGQLCEELTSATTYQSPVRACATVHRALRMRTCRCIRYRCQRARRRKGLLSRFS